MIGLLALASSCAAPAIDESVGAPPAPADYPETIQGSDVTFDMIWIEEGGFWIGRTEVTWDEFLLYCDFDGTGVVPPGADAVSKPSRPLDWTPYDHDWGAGKRPAVGMSWNSAKKYCQWLSLNTGHEYRLPSEGEWELACGPRPEEGLGEWAWYTKNSGMMTQEVGSKKPNEFGLFDMLGNLWEYCRDPYGDEDPEQAVLRGGSWKDKSFALKPARRLAFDYDWTLADPNFPPGVWWIPGGNHLGLRVLRPGEQETPKD
jgi:formylglycine-generating enzyme required for sulfatase activity